MTAKDSSSHGVDLCVLSPAEHTPRAREIGSGFPDVKYRTFYVGELWLSFDFIINALVISS